MRPVPVQVVDGVAPMILNVPAESGEYHANIKPRHLHARDIAINMAQERLLQYGHNIQVPATAGVVLTGAQVKQCQSLKSLPGLA